MPSPSAQDIDRVRERVLKDAEETFAKEVKKLVDGDSASFTSVPSANAGDGQREVPQDPGRHGGGCGPPDSPTGLGGVGGTPGPVKPLMESVTAAFPEAMRNLELPPLPLRWLAALEAGLLVQEDHLEQQHHQLMRVRLAAVKEASGLELDEPGAPPPTVLQTYAVPLQRVRQEPRATTLGAAHDGQIPVLDRCHEGVESNYNGVGEGPAV